MPPSGTGPNCSVATCQTSQTAGANMSAKVTAFSQENPDLLSCHGQINCTARTSVPMLDQVGYSVPRYAVSPPPMVTADHNSAVAATNLAPRGEAAPSVSQAADSRLTVLCRITVTMTLTSRKPIFISNMPSARYCAGFTVHSV